MQQVTQAVKEAVVGQQGAGSSKDDYGDEEQSFLEPVYATRQAIHPAPSRE